MLAVLGSMSEIPTYCFFIQFSGLEEVFQMLGNGAPSLVEEHADQLLRQPDRFILHAHLNAALAHLPGEDQELGGAVANSQLPFSFMARS